MNSGNGMSASIKACSDGPEVPCIRRFTYWQGSGAFGTRVGYVGLVDEASGVPARLRLKAEISSGVVLPWITRARRWMLKGWDGWRRIGSVMLVAGLDGSRVVI
jgi:hypothetical protein